MQYKVETVGLSDIGPVRQNNEDVWAVLPQHHFFALADGMGGHNAGEVAASIAVENFCEAVDAHFDRKIAAEKEEDWHSFLYETFARANQQIFEKGAADPELRGMGTTLCAALLQEETLYYGHVGDSRIYRFRKTLEQLTKDHSLRQQLLQNGKLNEASASTFPYKNIITRALGTQSHVEPDILSTKVMPDDIYMLCSDGLSDCVSKEEMTVILQQSTTLLETAKKLIEKAKQNGGTDNITVLLIKFTL